MKKEHKEEKKTEEEPEAKEERESFIRKALIAFAAIIILINIVGYTILTNVDIPGFMRSDIVKDSAIIGRQAIMFEGKTLEKIQKEYLLNQRREIKACLFGKIEEWVYIINKVTFPEIKTASVVHITTEGCPSDTLIDLHSHPWYKCSASKQDMKNFERLEQINPYVLMMIMCATDRFAVYD